MRSSQSAAIPKSCDNKEDSVWGRKCYWLDGGIYVIVQTNSLYDLVTVNNW